MTHVDTLRSMGWHHLEWLTKCWLGMSIVGRIWDRAGMMIQIRTVRSDPHVNDHVILEVFVFCNESIAMSVLKAHPSPFVDAIEILYSTHNGVCRIMRVYEHSQRDTGSLFCIFIENELKGHLLWYCASCLVLLVCINSSLCVHYSCTGGDQPNEARG